MAASSPISLGGGSADCGVYRPLIAVGLFIDGIAGAAGVCSPQHFLYFLPLPQAHGSFLPIFTRFVSTLS
jgi:hypothetical protein